MPDALLSQSSMATSKNAHESDPSNNSIPSSRENVNATPEDAVRYSLQDVTEGVDVEAIARENKRLSKLYDAFVERVGDVKPYKGKIQLCVTKCLHYCHVT